MNAKWNSVHSLPCALGLSHHLSSRSANASLLFSAVLALSQWECTAVEQGKLHCDVASIPDALEAVNNLKSVIPSLSDVVVFDFISPFLLYAFYKAAMIYVNQGSHVVRIRSRTSFKIFQDILSRLSLRWKVAGT